MLRMIRIWNRYRKRIGQDCRGLIKRHTMLAKVGGCLVGMPFELHMISIASFVGVVYRPS